MTQQEIKITKIQEFDLSAATSGKKAQKRFEEAKDYYDELIADLSVGDILTLKSPARFQER